MSPCSLMSVYSSFAIDRNEASPASMIPSPFWVVDVGEPPRYRDTLRVACVRLRFRSVATIYSYRIVIDLY